MPKETKKNLPAPVHQRLLNLARTADRPLNEFLQFYAIERFLSRLGETRFRRKFILKGAQMFRVWHEPTSRPTMDVDLLGTVEKASKISKKSSASAARLKSKTVWFFARKQWSAV